MLSLEIPSKSSWGAPVPALVATVDSAAAADPVMHPLQLRALVVRMMRARRGVI